MRTSLWAKGTVVILMLLAGFAEGVGQPPAGEGKSPKGPPDEDKEILSQIKDAYKAPFEVHEDVLKELRKAYQQPSAEREAKIFKELRRLYQMTERQEAAILREIRQAYERPSAEQEERIFREIAKADRLPPGAVSPSAQVDKTQKLFAKLDQNGDGVLQPQELPETLNRERGRWDADRNGLVNLDEYWAYYQDRLRGLSEQVAAGKIDLGLKQGGPAPAGGEEARTTGQMPQGLPGWFVKFDSDRDGQIGLYEWKKSGRSLDEFKRMDRNNDGLLTVEELLRYLKDNKMSEKNGNP